MNTGWIMLHRKLLENPLARRPAYCHLWVHLLLRACHREVSFIWNERRQRLAPGQLLTGRKQLSQETGIPEGTVEKILRYLETEQQIQQQTTAKFRIITIRNWGLYQATPDAEQQNDNHATAEEPHGDTYKKDKKENNEKKEKAKLLCELLSQEIRRRKSDFCEPPREQWLEPMAAMLELDGRSAERVEAVIQWSQRDPFWSVNILSPAALRKHFDRLELEMARVGTGESESLAQRLARLERAEGPSRRPHGIATMAVERDRRSPEAACRGFSTPTRRSRPYRRSDPGSLSQTSVVSARSRPARFCHLVLKEISFRFARLVVV